MSTRTRGTTADYYAVLGVTPTAGQADLRRAYRAGARALHPDVNKAPDAAARFALLTAAYDTLADPGRRRAYDLSRSSGNGTARPPAWGASDMPEAARDHAQAPHRDPTAPMAQPSLRGLDVRQTIHLTLREAAFGADRTIIVPRRDYCPTCRGTGGAPGTAVRQCPRCHGIGRGPRKDEACPRCHGSGGAPATPCATCDGRGTLPDDATFPLHFPAAIEDGEELRIKNEGNPGPQGGPRGDLRIRVEVERDPALRRRGSEVYADITLTPEQAARGGTIEVPTLRAPRRLRLPPNVADGAAFVLRGQGLRLKGKWKRGDQHVTIHVESGVGSRESGVGSRESGVGSREKVWLVQRNVQPALWRRTPDAHDPRLLTPD